MGFLHALKFRQVDYRTICSFSLMKTSDSSAKYSRFTGTEIKKHIQ